MESSFANIPSPIASSTPVHEVEYVSPNLPKKLDWNLDMIEHNYMCIVEEKEKIILQLKKSISEKDQIIEQLQAMNEMKEEGYNHKERVITPAEVLSCKNNAKHKPKRFVRNLLKLVFPADILANSCANGYGCRPALPHQNLISVRKSALAAFPAMTLQEFNLIVNQCCCDTRKKLVKK